MVVNTFFVVVVGLPKRLAIAVTRIGTMVIAVAVMIVTSDMLGIQSVT